jgi:uncharacterized protein (TIGR00251 family)
MEERLPFAAARDGLRLAVRLTPKAASSQLLGLIEDGRGGWAVKVAVTAPPVEGAANAALIRLLAQHFGLKPRDLVVAHGARGRSKVVEIRGDAAMLRSLLLEKLGPWLTRD